MANSSVTGEIAASRAEVDQPSISARLIEPFSRQLLLEAGLKPGMHVLDVLSGGGDLAFLARDIVGPDGHVAGFDPSGQFVAYANERAGFRGLRNVEFVQAQTEDLPFARDFDAIIGRLVLAYRRDPVADLKALVPCLRPAGILVFQEYDHLAGRTIPPVQLVEEVRSWLMSAFERAGIDVKMGVNLHAIFERAGLPPPRMRLDGLIGGAESIAPMLMTNVVRVLLTQLETMHIASPEDVQIDTLEERIRLALARTGSIMQSPLLIGAWTRLPT